MASPLLFHEELKARESHQFGEVAKPALHSTSRPQAYAPPHGRPTSPTASHQQVAGVDPKASRLASVDGQARGVRRRGAEGRSPPLPFRPHAYH